MQLGRHAKLAASVDRLRWARQATLLLVLLTAGLSVTSVQYLSRIVSGRRAVDQAAHAAHADWHDVLNLVEHKIGEHLPHQVTDQLAELGVGQRPQGLASRNAGGQQQNKQQAQASGGGTSQQAGQGIAGVVDSAAKDSDLVSDVVPEATAAPVSSKASAVTKRRRTAEADTCNLERHTDYGMGDAVKWGLTNKVDSWEHCCQQCLDFEPRPDSSQTCNVWVWCGDEKGCGEHYRECWLKYFVHPDAASPRKGPHVEWTSGTMTSPSEEEEDALQEVDPDEDRSFHVIITAEGSATHWQCRLHYYWYKKVKARCEAQGKCQMGGFTRILHSGKADDLMQEMPTFVAQPLPPAKHDHKGYVVLNRPYAINQWVQQANVPEKYIIMSEPDHVWLKPMPNLMKGQHPAAFPFFYISPATPDYNLKLTRKYTGDISQKEAEKISPIGNAPTMMSFAQLKQVAPTWMNLSLAIFHDEETAKEWGWVQEMYAFTIACYNEKIPKIHLHKKMMSQPPWDSEMEPFYLLHFTYGMDYTKKGVFTPGKYGEWRFDKRTYAQLPPPRHLGEPPRGMPNALVRHLIHAINEASTVIPGWDEYAATGVAKEVWDGVLPAESR